MVAKITTIAALMLALSAVPAAAALVSASIGTGFDGKTVTSITYKAELDEANRLSVDPDAGVVSDPGSVRLAAGGICHALDDHTAVCPVKTDRVSLDADLGRGDDSIQLDKPFSGESIVDAGEGDDSIAGVCYVHAGPGDDRVTGCTANYQPVIDAGPGDDTVIGGVGGEVVTGGGGHDVLDGGPGDDYITDGDDRRKPDADQLDGGPGFDQVTSYQERRRPLRVDLSVDAGNGVAGENDVLRNFESAVGGYGNDVLIGTPGHDLLVGALGRDRIEGRGGNDELAGGEGVDTIIGGPGDDTIHGRDEYRDAIDCGPGRDKGSADPTDVPRGCELVRPSVRNMVGARARASHGRAGIRLNCFDADALLSCAVRVTLRAQIRGRTVTVGTGRCRTAETCGSGLPVRLTRPAARIVAQRTLHTRATIVRIGDVLGALPQTESVTLVPGTEIWEAF